MMNVKGSLAIALGALSLTMMLGCGGGNDGSDGSGASQPSCDNGKPGAGSPAVAMDGGTAPTGSGGSTGAPPDGHDGGTGGTPGSDGGAPATDAGTTPTTDAGTPTTDAGTTPPTDAGTGGSDAGTAPTAPDPLMSPSTCFLEFSKQYINGSVCGEVRGTLPGMSWSGGTSIVDTDADGYLELHLASIPSSGTYDLSYLERECPGQPHKENWATYADAATLKAMSATGRSFISCNWWDPVALKTITVSSPSCNLRVSVDYTCKVTGAGNMKDFK